ncbi:contact-dependent growth inhibition system immunity protein [Viridibacterium curvum]|uniref:contact-dependent growth inhibition system immunity protein n=1 Tax=Viridibacterium curvum TaxID=1101404 RepID=UPI0031EA7C9C
MSLATQWARVRFNHNLICISTASGLRRSAYDPQGLDFFLPASCSDEELGQALLSSLEKSRVIRPEELGSFFDLKVSEEFYEAWVGKLLSALGMTRQKAFKGMKLCHASVREGILSLSPTRKERGEAWSGRDIEDEDTISLAKSSTPTVVGSCIRQALERCK